MSRSVNMVLAGFGGQGVLFAGKLIAYAGLLEDREVSWLPSYGPEMRGGTANCSVVLSDKPVGSPVFSFPTELIAMNGPSIDKFAPTVVSGGLVLVNSSVVSKKVERSDVKALYVPCEGIAYEVGNPKVANMVMLGAYVAATGALKPETIEQMIHEMFTGPKAKLVPLNLEALKRGMACAQ